MKEFLILLDVPVWVMWLAGIALAMKIREGYVNSGYFLEKNQYDKIWELLFHRRVLPQNKRISIPLSTIGLVFSGLMITIINLEKFPWYVVLLMICFSFLFPSFITFLVRLVVVIFTAILKLFSFNIKK